MDELLSSLAGMNIREHPFVFAELRMKLTKYLRRMPTRDLMALKPNILPGPFGELISELKAERKLESVWHDDVADGTLNLAESHRLENHVAELMAIATGTAYIARRPIGNKPTSKKPGVGNKLAPEANKYSMLPELHDHVKAEVRHRGLRFHDLDTDVGCIDVWNTNVIGRLVCHNPECPKRGGESRLVAVRVRLYAGSKYNAMVYHQRCGKCGLDFETKLDPDTYVNMVACKLKNWLGYTVVFSRYTNTYQSGKSGRQRAGSYAGWTVHPKSHRRSESS